MSALESDGRSHLREKLKGRATLPESPSLLCHRRQGRRKAVRETMSHKYNVHCSKWQPHERLPVSKPNARSVHIECPRTGGCTVRSP